VKEIVLSDYALRILSFLPKLLQSIIYLGQKLVYRGIMLPVDRSWQFRIFAKVAGITDEEDQTCLLFRAAEHGLISNELELSLEMADLTFSLFDLMHEVEGRGNEGRVD
jgi:hypothetical protein